MQKIIKFIKQNKLIILIVSSLFILIFLLILIYQSSKIKQFEDQKIVISNYHLLENVPPDYINAIFDNIEMVAKQNNQTMPDKINSRILEDNFNYQKNENSDSITFTIDFFEQKQAYDVFVAWSKNNQPVRGDSILVTCPENNPYPEFDCIDGFKATTPYEKFIASLPYQDDNSNPPILVYPDLYQDGSPYYTIAITDCRKEKLFEAGKKTVFKWFIELGLTTEDIKQLDFNYRHLCDQGHSHAHD